MIRIYREYMTFKYFYLLLYLIYILINTANGKRRAIMYSGFHHRKHKSDMTSITIRENV